MLAKLKKNKGVTRLGLAMFSLNAQVLKLVPEIRMSEGGDRPLFNYNAVYA